jgi:DNA-binding response OmpR family regulator
MLAGLRDFVESRTGMATGKRILLVDDDAHLRAALTEQLSEDFVPVEAATAAEGRALALAEGFDAILLDVGLPDQDGRELCRALREAGIACPILMLTGATEEHDMISGLDAGASDYVTKPFRIGELMARLRAQLRQHAVAEDAEYAIGAFRFQPARKRLVATATGARIRLTDKEAAILRHLYRAGGEVVPRDALLGAIWGYNSEVNTHTLETHIYRLRQKIEADAANATLLVTAPGGYRLVR